MSDNRRRSRGAAIARRSFLAFAGVVGGGLLVGAGALAWRLKTIDGYKLPARDGEASFGAWIRIARDGAIEVVVPHQDMGQGIYALAVLLAAEGLKVPPSRVRAAQAPIDAIYGNPVMLLDGLPMDEAALSAPQRARRCGPSTRFCGRLAFRRPAARPRRGISPSRSARQRHRRSTR